MGKYICPRWFDTLNREERRQQRWDRRLMLPRCETAAPLRDRFQQLVARWAFPKDELVYVNGPCEEVMRWIVWLHAEEAVKGVRLVSLSFSSTLAGRSMESAMVLGGHILRCPAFSLVLASSLALANRLAWLTGGEKRARMTMVEKGLGRRVTQNRNIGTKVDSTDSQTVTPSCS